MCFEIHLCMGEDKDRLLSLIAAGIVLKTQEINPQTILKDLKELGECETLLRDISIQLGCTTKELGA